MATERSTARAICAVLNELADAGSADIAESFYKLPGVFYEPDKTAQNSFVISDENKKPLYRVTVEKTRKGF